MAARGKKIQINLLPQEEFAASTFGRILRWAVGAFRIIVISVEMVVMIAFLSRFWLDARATDLDDEIDQKKAIITAQSDFEGEFKGLQTKLAIFSSLTGQLQNRPLLSAIAAAMPADVSISAISVADGKAQINASALVEESIAQYIVNLKTTSQLKKVTLAQVSSKSDSPFITFVLDADLNQ